MKICKVSPEHPVSPEDPNQAQLTLENPGDITGYINIISPDISPEENRQNQAKREQSGDTSGSGDIIHTSSPIHRLGHSDTFACQNCNLKGDIWFMEQHNCRGQARRF
jgi:hypothetical protein